MAGVAFVEFSLHEIHRRTGDHLIAERLAQLQKQILVAPEITRLEKRGADGQIAFGETYTIVDRPGRVPNLQPQVPEEVENILNDLLAMGRLLPGEQKQQIDIREWCEFTTAISAHGHDRHPVRRCRVGRGIFTQRGVVNNPQHLIKQEGEFALRRIAVNLHGLEPCLYLRTALLDPGLDEIEGDPAAFGRGGNVGACVLDPGLERRPVNHIAFSFSRGHVRVVLHC